MRRTVFLLLIPTLLVAACGSPGSGIELAPASDLTPALRRLPPDVQRAYRFALANRDVLEKIPCYCGCGNIGHTDNYACYVRSVGDDGRVIFDHHAAG